MHSISMEVPTSASPAAASAFVTDLDRLPQWSVCVASSTRTSGEGDPGSEYLLRCRYLGITISVHCVITEGPDRAVRFTARTWSAAGRVVLEVRPQGEGSLVTLNSDYEYQWPLTLVEAVIAHILDRAWRDSARQLGLALDAVAQAERNAA